MARTTTTAMVPATAAIGIGSTARVTVVSGPLKAARSMPGSSSDASPTPRAMPRMSAMTSGHALLDDGQADHLPAGHPEGPQEGGLTCVALGIEQDDGHHGQAGIRGSQPIATPNSTAHRADQRRRAQGRIALVA